MHVYICVCMCVCVYITQVEDPELSQALTLWEWAKGAGGESQGARWGPEWGVSTLAALQRVELSLAAHMDMIYGLVSEACVRTHTCRYICIAQTYMHSRSTYEVVSALCATATHSG